jgi:hypothetical protein
MDSYDAFRATDTITRAEMAKVISSYIRTFNISVIGPTSVEKCSQFSDLNQTNAELQSYIIQACELGLMGYHADGVNQQPTFRPNDTISQAEVATVVSRMLRGERYRGTEQYWYQSHLLALSKSNIMEYSSNPLQAEIRESVFQTLYNVSQKYPTSQQVRTVTSILPSNDNLDQEEMHEITIELDESDDPDAAEAASESDSEETEQPESELE